MKKVLIASTVAALLALTAAAQPTIRATDGVLNASSYAADIARGSWFVVFGTGLGPANISVYSGAVPYPATLSNTSVAFTPAAGGSAIPALLWYTSANQLAGLLPSSAPAGNYTVKVTYNGQSSAAYAVKVVDRNFGFATQAQNGQGPAQATYGGYDLNRFTTGTLGQYAIRPAKPGDVMILWGTGLGPDTASDQTGASSGDQTAAGSVKVVVGGVEVTPAYAGRSNGAPGLDQINFTVPSNTTPSCFVSLAVKAGGRTSNLGTIAVAASGQSACSNDSFTPAQLTRLDQGGSITIGSLNLSKMTSKLSVAGFSFSSTSESASGSFSRLTIDGVASSNYAMQQVGACFIFRRVGTSDQIIAGGSGTLLDAGAQLTLNGPNASNKVLTKSEGSYGVTLYSNSSFGGGATGTPTITNGTYTIAGPGGKDIGAFTASLNVPGDFTWTNMDALGDTISRGSNMPINWTGGGTGLVSIIGMSANVLDLQTQKLDAAVFVCTAPASANTFSVPSSVLQQLPAVASGSTSAMGFLVVTATPDGTKNGAFAAPLTAGGNVDLALFTYALGGMKTVGWN